MEQVLELRVTVNDDGLLSAWLIEGDDKVEVVASGNPDMAGEAAKAALEEVIARARNLR